MKKLILVSFKLKNAVLFLFLLSFAASFLTGCKNDCSTCSQVQINDQVFTIAENSPNGTVVGTIQVGTNTKLLTFRIISGDPAGTFKMDSITGTITVKDSTSLNFEISPKYNLVVKANCSADNLYSIAKITINITDVQPATNGLLSFYKLDKNAQDFLAMHHGTASNIYYRNSFLPQHGFAAEFNGTNSYVELGSAFDYPRTTINLWFYADNITTGIQQLYTLDNANLNYGLRNIALMEISSAPKIILSVSGSNDNFNITVNTWHMVTMITDQMNYRLYIDGQEVKNSSFASYIHSVDGTLNAVLGASRGKNNSFFKGMIDNVRIYDRALTAAEVHVLYME